MTKVTSGQIVMTREELESLPQEERARLLTEDAERKELEGLIAFFNHLANGSNGTGEKLRKLRKYLKYPSRPKLVILP